MRLPALLLGGAVAALAQSPEIEFFERRIRPVLVEQCEVCHSSSLAEPMGGLVLDSRDGLLSGGSTGPAVVPGNPDASLMLKALRYLDPVLKMPPTGKLPDRVIEDFRAWIVSGATDPRSEPRESVSEDAGASGPGTPIEEGRSWWAFQPLRERLAPDVSDPDWTLRKVDAFVLAKLDEHGMQPSPAADPRTLIRRAYLDLTGLPPSFEETEAFAADPSMDAYSDLIDSLLRSPRYGERWGRYWLDVARWAEDHPTSEATNRPFQHAWRYRDWVIEAINKDIPYDRFIRMQFAADLLPGFEPADMRALGYLGNAPVYHKDRRLSRDVIETIASDDWDERVDAVSRGLLGLTVACARCHDHKFDPITAKDYYALAGVFASTWQVNRPMVALDPERANWLTWKHEELYRTKGVFGNLKDLDTVAEELHAEILAMKPAYERLELELSAHEVPMTPAIVDCGVWVDGSTPTVTRMDLRPGQPRDLPVFVRGNVANPGEVVPRRFLSVFERGEPAAFKQGSGRLELAEKIVGEAGPLAARVWVNRVWGWHFGRHLVRTPSDFGTQGQDPTHPALLEDLAARFVVNGWSLKWLHREIMLSAAYRQSSRDDPETGGADPTNRLLWKMNPRRLDVEAWRDSILSASGELSLAGGGPSSEVDSPDVTRRSVYSRISRGRLHPVLQLYDFPVATQHSPFRQVTTTPLQQLFVLNSGWMQARGRSLAEAVGPVSDRAGRIRAMYRRAYGRDPSAVEVELGLGYLDERRAVIGREPWDEYAHTLLAANEISFLN